MGNDYIDPIIEKNRDHLNKSRWRDTKKAKKEVCDAKKRHVYESVVSKNIISKAIDSLGELDTENFRQILADDNIALHKAGTEEENNTKRPANQKNSKETNLPGGLM